MVRKHVNNEYIMFGFQAVLLLVFITGLILLARFLLLVYKATNGTNKYSKEKRMKPSKTIICIGSGGHTTEMVKLIENLNPANYNPRFYIMANTDSVSETKIVNLEKHTFGGKTNYKIMKIPRSRVVNQSYVTSVFTTLNATVRCFPIVFNIKPDLILCNGPGTCIPICLIAFLMNVFVICKTRIVFIESICRVDTFSLTGKILMFFADNIIVHWEELQKNCKRADYLGQLF